MTAQVVILSSGAVFEESSRGIHDALTLLDVDSTRRSHESAGDLSDDATYIILGLHKFKGPLPKTYIAVQSEQTSSKWFTDDYVSKLKKAAFVWDFSPLNVARCIGQGIANVCWVPARVPMDIFVCDSEMFNYHFGQHYSDDIDVLFYGSESLRRREMFRILSKLPRCRVAFRYYTLFGKEREDLIRRAKIVLNIHFWPGSALEAHRIEYACARGKCVISEPSADKVLDATYSKCVDFARYADIPSRVTHLLGNDEARLQLEREAQKNCFRNQFDRAAIKACISSIK